LLSNGKKDSDFYSLSEVPNVTRLSFLNFNIFSVKHPSKFYRVYFSNNPKSESIYFLLSAIFFVTS